MIRKRSLVTRRMNILGVDAWEYISNGYCHGYITMDEIQKFFKVSRIDVHRMVYLTGRSIPMNIQLRNEIERMHYKYKHMFMGSGKKRKHAFS